LVDADFRQPACHHALGLPLPRFGLSTLLERHGTLDSVIVPGGVPNLAFLPSGPRPRDPAALLSSEQIFELLDTVTEQYRWVVIDSPPVLPVSDAAVLAPIVDGVLLVVRAHATPVEAVQVARDRLEFLGAKILGVVLNDVRVTRSRYFYANYA
ncbi:MAG: capsular biosynthesis protein, partial [Candidatus Rokuibacteriota bacterium]